MNGGSFFRRWLLKTLVPLTRWFGSQHVPFTRKLITGLHYYDLRPRLKKGMVLLSRVEGEASNLVIPGFYTHAAIYVGGPWVVEAVGKGVVKTDLITFLLKKDYVMVRAPNFVSEVTMAAAADWATTQLGMPYDYELQSSMKAFYCSELVGAAYTEASDGQIPFTMRDTLGEPTITPQDIANAHKLWFTLWESSSAKADESDVPLISGHGQLVG